MRLTLHHLCAAAATFVVAERHGAEAILVTPTHYRRASLGELQQHAQGDHALNFSAPSVAPQRSPTATLLAEGFRPEATGQQFPTLSSSNVSQLESVRSPSNVSFKNASFDNSSLLAGHENMLLRKDASDDRRKRNATGKVLEVLSNAGTLSTNQAPVIVPLRQPPDKVNQARKGMPETELEASPLHPVSAVLDNSTIVTTNSTNANPSALKRLLQHRRKSGRKYSHRRALKPSTISGSILARRTLSERGEHDVFAPWLHIVLVILFVAVLALCGMLVMDRVARPKTNQGSDTNSQVRQWVRSLQVLPGEEVQATFKARGGYDCLLHQPQVTASAVRLEGQVVALPQSFLKAPLARCKCVLFSTSAAPVRLDGVRAPPTAFCAMNSDFDLELPMPSGALRVRIRGVDVALFDVSSGWQRERAILADAPDHLQDFFHAHRSPGVGAVDSSEELDFTECRLDVGAHVTCVGELRREPSGELCLRPHQSTDAAPAASDCGEKSTLEKSSGFPFGLTSWEVLASPRSSPRMGKVMISDDPAILGHAIPGICSSMLRRVRSLIGHSYITLK